MTDPTPPAEPSAPEPDATAAPEAKAEPAAAAPAVPLAAERGAPPPPGGALGLLIRQQSIIVPLIAVIIAFLIGAVLIRSQGVNPTFAYQSLFTYAFGTSEGLSATFFKMVPLILASLAVAIPLRVGLFNIGGQGQVSVGAIAAAATAYVLREAPGFIIIVAAMLVAMLAGLMWASIAALLKTTRGVHEVITTIMLNSIAAGLIDWLLNGPLKDPAQAFPMSRVIPQSAQLSPLGVVPIGLPIAILLAIATAWMLRRTTLGFEFDTVGKNRFAAGYAGINLTKTITLAMGLAGAFAGLAGSIELLEVDPYRYQNGIIGSIGFDGITIALLARGNPLGTIPAALLFGAMRAGASKLQFDTGLAPEIVDMILAITLLLVSLPIIAKLIFRKHTAKTGGIASSWGA